MTRMMAVAAVCAGLNVMEGTSALAQEPACKPLYDAVRD